MKKILFIGICLFISFELYSQEPVNVLQKIYISAESGSAIIGLDFDGPVSFTSMKLTDPFRIVLDITDCKKGGSIKNSLKVNSDGIKEISISQMGSDDAPILRVTIITTVDLDFNIEPTDNGINLKIAGVKFASQEETSKSSSSEVASSIEVTPREQEEVRPSPLPSAAVAEAKPEPQPAPEPAPVVAEAKPEPQPATVVKEDKSETPSFVASNENVVPEKQEKKSRFKPAPAMSAVNEETESVQHFTPPPRKKSLGGRNAITWIGFQMSATGSRVFIKTRDEAEYSIKEKDEKTLVLEIYNADIPKKNNRRPLDTSFFNSPVAYISPEVDSGSIKVIKIEIKLKERVPFITKQESNALYVDFEGKN